jgi:hypothetical protein
MRAAPRGADRMWRLVLGCPLLLACATPHLRGASPIDREKEPRGSERATLIASDCRDERNAPSRGLDVELVYLDPSGGPRRLLERRNDHDSVLIENSYEEGSVHVFAYISSDAKHAQVLHLFRLTSEGTSGELSLSRAFALHETNRGFRAESTRTALRCKLGLLRPSP